MSDNADACRYSVREVGFVDLDAAPYYAWLHIPADLDEATASELRRAAQIEFLHAPVVVEEEDGTGEMAESMATNNVPAGGLLLISPEGRTRVIAPNSGAPSDVLHALVHSPTRIEIADALDSFCQLLLIESPDPDANITARGTAMAAITEITANMDKMDKPVERTAELITVAHKDLERESVLLWSLGLEAASLDGPRIAVLFGRARRLGGVLVGDKVLLDELVRVMALAGTSCECGLERKWMQGPMLLMRWDRALQQRIAEHLGFDPESPVVKTEISQILAKGGSGEGSGRKMNSMLAYTEHHAEVLTSSAEGEALIEDVPLGDGPIMAATNEPDEPEDLDVAPVAPITQVLAAQAELMDSTNDSGVEATESTGSRLFQVVMVIIGVNAVLLVFLFLRSRRA